MNSLAFTATSETDTDRLGHALARCLPETATIALEGTLGAGKTRLVQAIAAGCGLDPQDITSPTFVLCQQYTGQRALYHLDAYRVHDLDEFLELGVEEYFDSPGLTLIEWADRIAPCLPDQTLTIVVEITGAETRQFTLTAQGGELQSALDGIADLL